MAKADPSSKYYYFIDIDLHSRQILNWDVETGDFVEMKASSGCHRVFLSRGQYNKLVKELENR